MRKRRIRYAVIGSGKHAVSTFIPAIAESYNSELSCVTTSETLRESKSRLLIDPSIPERSVEEILNDPLIDAVYIASPNSTHAEYVSDALSKGKNVLCEKPLAYNSNDIEKIKADSKGANLFATGFMYRLHPQYEVIKAMLKNINFITFEAHFNYSLNSGSENIRLSKDLGGGCLLDVGCYLVDIVRYLDPMHEFTYSTDVKYNTECGIDSQIEIISCYDGINVGPKVQLSGSQNSERSQGLIITTDMFVIKSDSPFLIPRNKKVSLLIKHKNGREIKYNFLPFNQHAAQINLFSESIIRGELLGPLSTGIKNATILSSLWSDINNMSKIDSKA